MASRSTPASAVVLVGVLLLLLVVLVYAMWSPTQRPFARGQHRLRGSTFGHHLILVPCHGVFLDRPGVGDAASPDNWATEPYVVPLVPSLVEHVRTAVKLAAREPERALVMFSGGRTQKEVKWSEAEGYERLARRLVGEKAVKTVPETRARDSFENLMFSMCEHKRVAGAYPKRLTVVGFDFKKKRFLERHAVALRLTNLIEYVGMQPELNDEKVKLEMEGVIPQFERDPYGCEPPLSTKRERRDAFGDGSPADYYARHCPELVPLFKWCAKTTFAGKLPWD